MGIKIKKLFLKDFERFVDFAVEFGSSVTRLIGLNGAGKTTVGCTAIWAGLRGIAEKSTGGQLVGSRFHFIRNGKSSADIQIELQDDSTGELIVCKNHITSSSNKISFTSSSGRQLTNEWMNKLFSVVFMSAKNFCLLSGKEQALQLGIDTSVVDKQIKELKENYTILNREYKAFGEIEPVEPATTVDVQELWEKKKRLQDENQLLRLEIVAKNKKLRDEYFAARKKEEEDNKYFNESQVAAQCVLDEVYEALQTLKTRGYSGQEVEMFIKTLRTPQPFKTEITVKEPEYEDELVDEQNILDIDEEIAEAYETNNRAELYDKYVNQCSLKEAKRLELDANRYEQERKQEERLKIINAHEFSFGGLSVDDAGGLLLNDRPLRDPYYSKGELEVIVAELASSINPEWKTRFVDDFDLLDEDNQSKLIYDLTSKGYQVIVAEVGEKATRDGSIVLKECGIKEIIPECEY